MSEQCLSDLVVLSIECDFSDSLELGLVVDIFTHKHHFVICSITCSVCCCFSCTLLCSCGTLSLYYYSCVSVRPSITGGQRKRFDPETQDAVSLAIERQKLEPGNLCERQP